MSLKLKEKPIPILKFYLQLSLNYGKILKMVGMVGLR